MPLLIDLLVAIEPLVRHVDGAKDASIRGITQDSRTVGKGFLFAALRGLKQDGVEYAREAAGKGAVAIISESAKPADVKTTWIEVSNARRALALVAAAFYGAQPMHMAAVTGTDGKTSTADFFRQLAGFAGYKAAAIGTLGITGDPSYSHFPAIHTTPDPVLLQRILAELSGGGCDWVAMEASSHGLDQFRLDGVKLKAAAFTNLTRDHLDYHQTPQAYFSAKQRLFGELLPQGSTAVLNADDAASFAALRDIAEQRGHRMLTYGTAGKELRLVSATPTPSGQEVEFSIEGQSLEVSLDLVGAFQSLNILAAIGLFIGAGGKVEAVLPKLGKLKGVPGRLEHVATHSSGAAIYIDYAHTPAALENLLKTLRPHVKGKLHVVFGCGGDRDTGKRAPMGTAAYSLADKVIVTDDNPRSENPAAIRQAVLAGAPGATEIGDRKQAIHAAISELKTGDILVIAGKGHEKTQTIGDQLLPFDDAQVAREAIGVKRKEGAA